MAQISISDDNHHVTEAIGDMYGDSDYGKRDSRPLSFVGSPLNDTFEQNQNNHSYIDAVQTSRSRNRSSFTMSEKPSSYMNGQERMAVARNNSFENENGPLSPNLSMRQRQPSDTANSQFPLNNLDYESNPAAVAQELSNLQALRRMSMDVNAAGDPDLPAFSGSFGMPTVAPTSSDDEDDTSRLFWVPARIHPELAPKEFKSFLDSRVNSLKRRSGDSSLSADGPHRHGSGGGLRRKKSMLSKQIDNSGGRGAEGYTDGAERLERKRSSSAQQPDTSVSKLQELEVLVNDPAKVIQRLSLDTEQHATGGEVPASEDMPILPAAPPGQSLRRSTRTTYRRGSLRKGERVPFSRRAAKAAETDAEDSPVSSPITGPGDNFKLSRVQTEPMPTVEKPAENFSRPSRSVRSGVSGFAGSQAATLGDNRSSHSPSGPKHGAYTPPVPKHFVSSFATNGRSSLPAHVFGHPVPQIIETPPPSEETKPSPSIPQQAHIPERISSHEPPPSLPPQGPLPHGPPQNRGPKRPVLARQNQSTNNNQTLNDMASHPSPLPGNSTRTDSLSFIPTLTEDKKQDVKKNKDRKEKEGSEGVRKSSWSWGSLLGSEEKEKEKRKEEDIQKKGKVKLAKPLDKSHDNTRLDLLQTTMDSGRGRESLVLDRDDVKLEEERKKESSRKTLGGEAKKEKDSGLFSSFFGGGKKKTDRELVGKKISSRTLSPDPPHHLLKPDVDYNWTRFSLLEERAIYRMAHIKLANPRRALYSQVLLSNFMYSYLAKVQQMHPQIQVPQSAAQRQQQQKQQAQQQAQPQVQPQTPQQAQQRKPDQPEEYYQYQNYQDVRDLTSGNDTGLELNLCDHQQQQQQDHQRQTQQPAHAEGVSYIEDSEMYDHDHGPEHDDHHRPQSRASQHSLKRNGEHGQVNVDGNGYAGHPHTANGAGGHYRSQQQQQQQQPISSKQYKHQQFQFEESREQEGDNEMW